MKALHAILVAASLLSFVAADSRESSADEREQQSLRVMSFNIRYGTAKDGVNEWSKRREFLIETIKQFNPDLLGTQETLKFQRDYLEEALEEYGVLGVGRNDGADDGEMMALYYRKSRFELLDSGHFWLSESPEKVGSKSWDSSLPRMVTWVRLKDKNAKSTPSILFLNTHFDHKGPEARLQSAKLIRKKIAELRKGSSVVLTGDFNTDEGTPPYQELFGESGEREAKLVDSFRKAHPERRAEEGTFSNFTQTETKGARIDWIGLSPDWKVKQAEINRSAQEGRTPSDHFPIQTIVELE